MPLPDQTHNTISFRLQDSSSVERFLAEFLEKRLHPHDVLLFHNESSLPIILGMLGVLRDLELSPENLSRFTTIRENIYKPSQAVYEHLPRQGSRSIVWQAGSNYTDVYGITHFAHPSLKREVVRGTRFFRLGPEINRRYQEMTKRKS